LRSCAIFAVLTAIAAPHLCNGNVGALFDDIRACLFLIELSKAVQRRSARHHSFPERPSEIV
jgi:hypothetical protein